jgi:hypothetical protein
MQTNLAHLLIKKKPESELRLLVQKHSSGIEHVSESSTPNGQKKARELRSGFSIQFRGYTFMNDANVSQQVFEDNTDFLIGDVVVLKNPNSDPQLLTISAFQPSQYYWIEGGELVHQDDVRTATTAELQAKRRLSEAEQALAEVP